MSALDNPKQVPPVASQSRFRRTLKPFLGPSYRAIRRQLRFLRWISETSRFLSRKSDERRLLVVYDLSANPYSIGDVLVVVEASMALREIHGVGQVDFAFVFDEKQPVRAGSSFGHITADDVFYHLASIVPTVQVNPQLGSLFVFNSHLRLEQFLADNAAIYVVWPSAWKYAQNEYLNYTAYNDVLWNHRQKHGTIPILSSRPFLVKWANEFYSHRVHPRVPVTVQVRNNPSFGAHRNLRLDVWIEFFLRTEKAYPACFVIVCAANEIDDRLRQCRNVIVSKDYHTGIEQDLALIQTASFHMGASSGPGQMAIFGTKPYLLVNTDLEPNLYKGIVQDGAFLRFCFAGPLQRFAVGEETVELLTTEFARMWEAVTASTELSDRRAPGKRAGEPLSWLR